jgi:hypothetical protein
VNSFSGGAIKEDRIPLGLPDGCEFDRARTMQAKEEAAWQAAADENSFGDRKSPEFELVLFT